MNAPVKDPARAALAYVLDLTRANKRFPREDVVMRKRGHADAVRRLIEDGRYLAVVVGGDEKETFARRIALTVAGTYEVDGEAAVEEAQGLARTHDKLAMAAKRSGFIKSVLLKKEHAQLAADMDLLDFRRWATMLCSPRLQSRYLHDPHGFCGNADAIGRLGNVTGFFTHVRILPSFLDWRLPKPGPRRAFLLSEDGLRVNRDEHGYVHVWFGLGELAVLAGNTGPLCLEALVSRRGKGLHSLDLQMHASGLATIDDDPDCDPDEVTDALEEIGIKFDATVCDRTELERLAAVLRRLDVLGELSGSEKELPRWASPPAARLRKIKADLRAELITGPLKADSPLVKNATRVVRKALDELLKDRRLEPFRHDFEIAEWAAYRPVQ
jgi:hypothetical protein